MSCHSSSFPKITCLIVCNPITWTYKMPQYLMFSIIVMKWHDICHRWTKKAGKWDISRWISIKLVHSSDQHNLIYIWDQLYLRNGDMMFCSVRKSSKIEQWLSSFFWFAMDDISEILKQVDDDIKADKRICPWCRNSIGREKGCNYVICPSSNCGMAFCFLCATEMPKGRSTCTTHTCIPANFRKIMMAHRLNQPIPSGQNQKKVMVATPTNDILSIVFDSNMTVGTLKDRISAKIAVDSKNIMLHYHGYTMDNNSVLLTSYHVQENTTIQMSVRVNGGCLTKY